MPIYRTIYVPHLTILVLSTYHSPLLYLSLSSYLPTYFSLYLHTTSLSTFHSPLLYISLSSYLPIYFSTYYLYSDLSINLYSLSSYYLSVFLVYISHTKTPVSINHPCLCLTASIFYLPICLFIFLP